MDSCEIYNSMVESERPVLTRNPAEVISIPKWFIDAWRLSDPSGATIFGWHLAEKPNLAVPPLTGIPFCSGWHLCTSMFPCELHTHIVLEKPYQGWFSSKGVPRPRPFPLLICVVGFNITLVTHERTMLRNHLWAPQCLAIRVKGFQMAVNNVHDREIQKGNAPAKSAGSWKECICSCSPRLCACADRNNGIKV